MPQRNVASNFTFEQQRVEINELAADFWSHKGTVDTAAGTYLLKDGSNAFTGATLSVPNAFTIASNAGAGTVTINANLQVQGTTTTLNSTTLEIADKNIIVAKGSANDAAADGAGLTVDSGGGDKTFNFVDAKDAFVSNIRLESTNIFTVTGGEGLSANLYLIADEGDDNGDGWRINSNQDDNDLTISNNATGTYVDKLTVTADKLMLSVDLKPDTHNTKDLGTDTNRFQNAYFGGTVASVNLDVDGTTDLDVTNVDGALTMMAGWNLAFQNGFNNKTSTIVNAGASGKSNLEFKVDDGNGLDKRLSILNTGTVKVNKGGGIGMSLVPANNTDTFQVQFDLADTTNKGYINYDFSTNRMKFRAGGSGEVLNLSNGGAILASSGSTNGGVLDLTSTQTSNYTWRLAVGGGDNAYVHGRGFFIRDENAGATRLAIDENGNVGMGVTQPDCELHVKGAGTVARFEGTGGNAFIDLYDSDDSTRCFVGVDGGTFKIQTSGNSWSDKLTVSPAGDLAVPAGTISDSKGSLRRLPQNNKSAGYNLVTADAGKHINTTGDVGLYTGNFEIGDAVTIFNKGTAAIAISLGGGVTMYQAGTSNVGNRGLDAKGICTILCTEKGSGTNTFVISGAGLT